MPTREDFLESVKKRVEEHKRYEQEAVACIRKVMTTAGFVEAKEAVTSGSHSPLVYEVAPSDEPVRQEAAVGGAIARKVTLTIRVDARSGARTPREGLTVHLQARRLDDAWQVNVGDGKWAPYVPATCAKSFLDLLKRMLDDLYPVEARKRPK